MTPLNSNWDQDLVDRFLELPVPAGPVRYGGIVGKVSDPERFFHALRKDINLGPTGPRARTGALRADLRAVLNGPLEVWL